MRRNITITAHRAWLAPGALSLLATLLLVALGDLIALLAAFWFCWCMTQARDAEHRAVRYLGWGMLIAIASSALRRLALGLRSGI